MSIEVLLIPNELVPEDFRICVLLEQVNVKRPFIQKWAQKFLKLVSVS